jgi:hypothetical protein
MSDKDQSMEEQVKIKSQQARKLARYMSSTADLVENQILKAQERGDFNNLDGHGKPLRFEENPYEPPELRMIFKILKENDCAPYWIELGKEIDADFAKHQQELERFRSYAAMFHSSKHNRQAVERFEKRKESVYFEERMRLEAINKKILDYNLMCPTYHLGRQNIAVEELMLEVITQMEAYLATLRQTAR